MSGPADSAPLRGYGIHLALRLAWSLVRCALLAFLGTLLLAMFFENSLVFVPMRYPDGQWNPPGLEFEDAWFQSSDGTRLHGWYVPHRKATAVILFCHGNGGNVTHRAEAVRSLHDQAGAAVLVFDYRGYGQSAGRPDEKGVLMDARAARAWLAKRAGIAEQDIVMLGESLGGAVAVDLAAADGARGLILESTFTSAPAVAAAHFPWLPAKLLMRTRLDSLSKIHNYRGPLLQSHGDVDAIIPYALGRELFKAANQPKKFRTFAGIDHNDSRPADYYREDVAQFLRELK